MSGFDEGALGGEGFGGLGGSSAGEHDEGPSVVSLDAYEVNREVLRDMAEQMRFILGDPPGSVSARLYPAAYEEDPEADAEYRGLMAADLEARKRSDLERFAATLDGDGDVHLDSPRAAAWLGALQDMRVTIGQLLGIVDDDWDTKGDDANPWIQVLHYLGYLQSRVLEQLDNRPAW